VYVDGGKCVCVREYVGGVCRWSCGSVLECVHVVWVGGVYGRKSAGGDKCVRGTLKLKL